MNESNDRFSICCGGCGQVLQLRHKVLGRKLKCPNCQTVFRAPHTAPTVAPRIVQPVVEPAVVHSVAAGPTEAVAATAPGGTPQTPTGTRRCERCHQFVPLNEFDRHYRQHMGTREDGQLNQYPSLPPEKRWRGDLSTVPQFYEHTICGSVTGMPEDIIRTYLVNPYFYAYKSYCCGCERHVPQRELVWVNTGENMQDYTNRLKAHVPNSEQYRREAIRGIIMVALVCGCLLGLVGGLVGFFTAGFLPALLIVFVLTLLGSLGGFFLLLSIRGGI